MLNLAKTCIDSLGNDLAPTKHGYRHGHRTRHGHYHADTANNLRKSHDLV